jgi:hypothetical protein
LSSQAYIKLIALHIDVARSNLGRSLPPRPILLPLPARFGIAQECWSCRFGERHGHEHDSQWEIPFEAVAIQIVVDHTSRRARSIKHLNL